MKTMFSFLIAVLAFAMTANAQASKITAPKYDFNHCNDDQFAPLSLDKTTGLVIIRITPMNMPDSAIFDYQYIDYFQWFADITDMTVPEYRISDNAGIRYHRENDIIYATIHRVPITGIAISSNNVLTIAFKMSDEQIALLENIGGLPGKPNAWFSVGNISISN